MTDSTGELRTRPTRNGSDMPLRPPPRRTGTSMRPAIFVVALAAIIVAVFAIGSAVSTHPRGRQSSPGTATPPASIHGAAPAAPLLSPIITPGEPPSNILSALWVPQGTTRVGYQRNINNTQQYDRSVDLRSSRAEGSLVSFYRRQLRASGWKIESVGAPSRAHGLQVLAQKGGSDGWYWEVGVTVSPTTFSSGSGNSAAQSTRFRIELIQLSDNF